MATQIKYEVYTIHHKQEVMKTAQTNRDLNKLGKTSPQKNGTSSIITWIRSFVISNGFGNQNQMTL